jgi:hypothetical protein
MINLANSNRFKQDNNAAMEADKTIKAELQRAGIEVVNGSISDGEVITHVTGRLGGFKFWRAWTYWVCVGQMPLSVAQELWNHPTGVCRTDVRCCGHCGCPEPAKMVKYFDGAGLELILDPEGKTEASLSVYGPEFAKDFLGKHRFVRDIDHSDPTIGASITSYHVDSELGLYLLAEAIRKNNL